MRSNGSGNIYKRVRNGKVFWEGRVSVGFDPGTGKRIRKSVSGSTQREVQKKINDLIHALEHNTYHEPTRITVAEWCDQYIDLFAKDTLKPLTVVKYEATIRNHIKPRLGALKLQDVTGLDVQTMVTYAVRSGLSAKTVKDIAGLASKIFRTAYLEGLIDANPCARVRTPKAAETEIRPLTSEEIALFLDAIKSDRYGNAMAIQLFSGLREGELLGLSWENVDLEKGELKVDRQLQKHGKDWVIQPTTKNSRIRVVKLPEIAMPYLTDQKMAQMSERLDRPDFYDYKSLVFADPVGDPVHTNVYYKHFKAIAASIGRPDARPHDLRHTAATVAIASGADIKSVQDLLGHATASFTLNVYAHTSEAMRAATAERVNGFYESLKK